MPKTLIRGEKGFSLLELMVALMLIGTVFLLFPSDTSDGLHAKLEKSLSAIQRAIRFAANESIVRNSVVRLTFKYDENPVQYVVETTEGSEVPRLAPVDLGKLSMQERELYIKAQQAYDRQYVAIAEFEDQVKELPEDVILLGVGTQYSNRLVSDSNVSIYFYPTGEKDSALIVLGTEDEIATLDIPSFEMETDRQYYSYTEGELSLGEDFIERKARNLYEEWKREK